MCNASRMPLSLDHIQRSLCFHKFFQTPQTKLKYELEKCSNLKRTHLIDQIWHSGIKYKKPDQDSSFHDKAHHIASLNNQS